MKLSIDFIDNSLDGRLDLVEGTCILHVIPMNYLRRSFTRGYLHRSGYYFTKNLTGGLFVSYAKSLYEDIVGSETIQTVFVPELAGDGTEEFIETFEFGKQTVIGDTFRKLLQTAVLFQEMRLPVIAKSDTMEALEELPEQETTDFEGLVEEIIPVHTEDVPVIEGMPTSNTPSEPHTASYSNETTSPNIKTKEEEDESYTASMSLTEGIPKEHTEKTFEEPETVIEDVPSEPHKDPYSNETTSPNINNKEEEVEPYTASMSLTEGIPEEPETEDTVETFEVSKTEDIDAKSVEEHTTSPYSNENVAPVLKGIEDKAVEETWFSSPEAVESGEYTTFETEEEEEAEPTKGYDEVDHVPWFFTGLDETLFSEDDTSEEYAESSEPVNMGFDAEISFGDMSVDDMLQKAEAEAEQEETEEKERVYPYYLNSKGTLAEGEYVKGEGFLLHKGARVCPDITPSCAQRIQDLREQAGKNNQIDENNCTTEDILFKTANDASGFVLGSNPGNQTNWHTCNGLTLREQTVGTAIPKKEEVKNDRQNFFIMKRQGLEASLYYNPKERMYWVLKGQRLGDIQPENCSQDIQEWRYILRRAIDEAGYLKETVRFSTAARATSFIYGQNGIRMANWKNKVQLRLPDVVDKESA